jgi:hypothetical protein
MGAAESGASLSGAIGHAAGGFTSADFCCGAIASVAFIRLLSLASARALARGRCGSARAMERSGVGDFTRVAEAKPISRWNWEAILEKRAPPAAQPWCGTQRSPHESTERGMGGATEPAPPSTRL